jgi:hypothetical protein
MNRPTTARFSTGRLTTARLPADRARDALIAALEPYAAPFEPIAASSKDWASGLFVGARHRLAITLRGADAAARAERLQRDLPELELEVPHGFVADIQVTVRLHDAAPVLAIEALTIEDGDVRSAGGAAVSPAVRRAG